jgi:hypothetical protein
MLFDVMMRGFNLSGLEAVTYASILYAAGALTRTIVQIFADCLHTWRDHRDLEMIRYLERKERQNHR